MTDTNKQTLNSYYNKRFPEFLQQHFQEDASSLWQEIEEGLSEACRPSYPNYDLLITLTPKLEVYLTVYGPSQSQRELLTSIFLRLLLEEHTTTINKIVITRLILITLGNGNFKSLRLNWKAISDFFDEIASDPRALSSQTPKGKLLKEFTILAKRLRTLYPEDSIEEVLREIRQGFNPSVASGYKGSQLLNLFFNVETLPNNNDMGNFGQEYFEKKVIPELFAFWNGRRYQAEIAYLIVLERIARKYPRIDWSLYYEQIFTYSFNAIKSEFPQKDGQKTGPDGLKKGGSRGQSNRNPLSFVANLLVRIMRPKTFPGGEQYWENLERIYRSTLPFIHPENSGTWSGSLARFYHDFSKFYTKRANKEQRIIEKKGLKNKDTMEEEKDVFEDKDKTKDDEDAGRLDEVDIGFLDAEDQEEKDKEESDESEDEEDDTSEIVDLQAKIETQAKEETRDHFLDETCHHRFLEMIEYVEKNLIYSRDAKVIDQVAKTFRRLIFFRPNVFGPLLIKTLSSVFQRSDLSHIGYIKILLLCAYPLFSRKIFKEGIYELPKFLDVTLEHLTSHDIKKTAILLEFYEVVFALVPLYHTEDLKEYYSKSFGIIDVKTIKDKLNSNETQDIWQITEDLTEWVVKFFKKFVGLLKNFEPKEEPKEVKITSLVISYRNLHSIIFQSSARLIQRYLDIVKIYLEENLHNYPSQHLQDILHPLNLRDAESTLLCLFPLIKDQLLIKTGKDNTEIYSQKPLYNIIQKSPLHQLFLEYELKITNKDTLVRILAVLKELLSFSSPTLLKYKDDIELIIFHCLLHEDHNVFIRASQLLHSTLLSLLSVYPTNPGSLNPQDFTYEEFSSLFKKIGRSSKRNLELQWHVPNPQEIQYAQDLFSLFFEKNIQDIENQHLIHIKPQKSSDSSFLVGLLDDMHLKNVNMSNFQRENLGRSLILVNYSFLGVCQRASYAGVAILSQEKQRFESKYTISAFNEARERLYSIGNRLVQYTFSNLYVKDNNIGKALVQLIGTIYGEEEQQDDLQRRRKVLKQKRNAFELEGAQGDIFENRYLMTIYVNIKLQQKILGHSVGINFKENTLDLIYILWVFTFHPLEEVAKAGYKLFRRETSYMKPERKNEILLNVSNYTVKFVNERFSFLRSNAKELEENKVIKFNQNQIIYNNKDSYVDVLLKGTLYNLEYLLIFLTNHLENLFQFIQILLDVPKTNDSSFLLRFSRIITGLDFSPYLKKEDDIESSENKSILASNDLYEQYQNKYSSISSSKQVFYDRERLQPHVEAQVRKVIFILAHEESHWKYQVVAAFSGALLSGFLSPKSDLLSQFIECIFKLLSSEHLYLRYFASAAFPALIKIKTEHFRKDSTQKRKLEDFKGLQLTLDEAFKFHFLKKEDYQNNYLKNPHTGILDFYESLEIDDTKEQPYADLPKHLIEHIQSKDFLHKLLFNLVSDVPSQEEAGAQKGGSIAGLLGKMAFNFKGFIGEYFRHGIHKSRKAGKGIQSITSIFSQVEASLLRVLLKYFNGPKVFENSIDLIQEYTRDYNSREKQIIAAHYFFAVIKTYKFWDSPSQEKVTSTLADILSNVLDNVSADVYSIWNVSFSLAIKSLDFRILNIFCSKLSKNPFDKKLSHIQGRYLSIFETIIDRNGVFSEEVAEKILDILTDFKPTETRQVEHIAQILISLLKNYVLNPVNYLKIKQESIILDIDKVVQNHPATYVLENEYFLYRFNSKFDHILQNYSTWAKETPNPEENKIYFELLFILTKSFYSKKLPYSFYRYYEKTISFLLQLNSDENLSLSLNTIQVHKDSLTSLSKLLYPRESIPKILGLIQDSLKAKNSKVRENALRFYHYFYYNHLFYFKNKSVDNILDSILDENPTVKNTVFDVLVDIFRLYTENEIKNTVEQTRKLVQENKQKKHSENVTKGLQVLMAIVLSRPYEIEEWTDSTLEFLLEMKKYSKPANEKFNKDFALKFWDNHSGRANVNERELSYEVYSDLREIGNPSSYFA